jgi:2-haloacid dehalogenase
VPRILVFDANETLLDREALESQFQSAFREGKLLREWFDQVTGYAMALTLANA